MGSLLNLVVGIERMQCLQEAIDVVWCSRMHDIEVEGVDGYAVEDSADAPHYNEVHPMVREGSEDCQKIRAGDFAHAISEWRSGVAGALGGAGLG